MSNPRVHLINRKTMGKIDYVIYGEAAHFQGPFVVSGYVVDGVRYQCADDAEAKAYAEAHPDKWIKAGTHPACGVMYIMPDGAPHKASSSWCDIPIPYNEKLKLTLDDARALPPMTPQRNLVEVTCDNPNDQHIPTEILYRHVPNHIFEELEKADRCEKYAEENKKYDVVTGSCGGIDWLDGLDGLFEPVGASDEDAKALGWSTRRPTLLTNDRILRMLILFDD